MTTECEVTSRYYDVCVLHRVVANNCTVSKALGKCLACIISFNTQSNCTRERHQHCCGTEKEYEDLVKVTH